MFFTLQTVTSTLAFLSFSVRAFPLSQRDVIAPQIIEPDASSVWPVGTQQIVIWNTSGFPAQITNPIGQIILGFNESNSLNLNFNSPLAQGFELTDGNVTIIVPNVPPRDDYLIVLFGDSGDTSPAFAITRISSPVSGNSLSSASSSGSIAGATLPATSLSIPSSVVAPTSVDNTLTAVGASSALPPTGTTTTGSTGSSSISISNSNSASSAASASAASSSSSAGWSLHRGSSLWSSAAPFLMSVVAPFVMGFMV